MVQKSHSQPPGMFLEPVVNNGRCQLPVPQLVSETTGFQGPINKHDSAGGGKFVCFPTRWAGPSEPIVIME